jgi:hypothetical protein
VNTIDVLWWQLGLCRPANVSNYAYNSFACWSTPNQATTPISYWKVKEAVQTNCEIVNAFVVDSYEDNLGRVHALYRFVDDGLDQIRHAVLQNGVLVNDVALPDAVSATWMTRIFQDSVGHFYILSVNRIYPAASEDGTVLDPPITLNFGTNTVGSMHIAVPRGGSACDDVLHGVFTTYDNGPLMYFRIRLREIATIITPPASRTNAIGSEATFTVEASGGEPLSYQWQQNVTNLTNGGRITGVNTNTLTIQEIGLSDAGSYRVWVTNAVGDLAVSADAVLTVTKPPSPPMLSASLNGDLLSLSWGLAGAGFQLWGASNLASPVVWVPETALLRTNAQEITATVPISSDSRFFRLIWP